MLAKSRRNGAFADKSFLRKLQDGGRETLPGLLGGGTVLASSVYRACSVRADCLCQAAGMLVKSAQIACAECPKTLLRPSARGAGSSPGGFRKPKRAHFPLPKAVFYSLSNVRISLSSCHAADCGFPLPFFRSSPPEGRKNGFSCNTKVKVSKCKGWGRVPARREWFFPGSGQPLAWMKSVSGLFRVCECIRILSGRIANPEDAVKRCVSR